MVRLALVRALPRRQEDIQRGRDKYARLRDGYAKTSRVTHS